MTSVMWASSNEQSDVDTDVSSTDQSQDSELTSSDLTTSSSSPSSASSSFGKRPFGTNRDTMGNYRLGGGGDADDSTEQRRSRQSTGIPLLSGRHRRTTKKSVVETTVLTKKDDNSEPFESVRAFPSYVQDMEEDLKTVDGSSDSTASGSQYDPLDVEFQGEDPSKFSKVKHLLKVKKNALQKKVGKAFGALHLKHAHEKTKKLVHDGVFKTKTNVRYEKNAALQRIRPHALRLQQVTHRTGHKAKTGISKLGICIALNAVRLITHRKWAFGRMSMEADPDSCPYGDPFDFDVEILRHQPVSIPTLALKEETLLDESKPSEYFGNLKNARYSAIIHQASSKHTRELTLLLKNKQGKPKEIMESSVSIGPRLHIGFKCDVDKQSLTIRIMEATGLPGKDSNGLADPYCIVTLKPDAAIEPLRTRTIGKTVNPKWKEIFELSGVPPIATLQKQTLHIKVYDYDQLGADDLIGTLDIGLVNYDLMNGTDMWLDLRTKENTEKPQHFGNALIGLRYDQNQEKLTVYIERCEALKERGTLITKACLHINGSLIRMKKNDPEHTNTPNPELKQRIAFRHIRKTLLEEYAITVYFAFRRFYMYHDHFGQVNLSCKSKDHTEVEIWEEAKTLPGEVSFKLMTIHPFLGLIKKPWRPVEDPDSKKLGFLLLTLKISIVVAGMLLSCTIEKAEELALPKRTRVRAELYLIKDGLQESQETTKYKKMIERTTPFEETFDLYVDMDEIGSMGLVVILSRRHWFRSVPFAHLSLSTAHKSSVVPEMELWQSAIKSTGIAGTRKLELRPLRPEITLYRLGRSGEAHVPFHEAGLLPEKEPLGKLAFSLSYHETKEHLKLTVERVTDVSGSGKYFIRAFLWDLKKSRKQLQKSPTIWVNDSVLKFKTAIKFRNVNSSFFDTHFLCIRLMRKRMFWFSKVAGQAVIKIVKVTPYPNSNANQIDIASIKLLTSQRRDGKFTAVTFR